MLSFRALRWTQRTDSFFLAVKGSDFPTHGIQNAPPGTTMNQPTLKASIQKTCNGELFSSCTCSFCFSNSLQYFYGVHVTPYRFWFPDSKDGIPKPGIWTFLPRQLKLLQFWWKLKRSEVASRDVTFFGKTKWHSLSEKLISFIKVHLCLDHDIEKKLHSDNPVWRSKHSPSLCPEKAAENVAGGPGHQVRVACTGD